MQESLQVGALPSVLNDTVCHPLRSYKPILFSVKRRWKWIFHLIYIKQRCFMQCIETFSGSCGEEKKKSLFSSTSLCCYMSIQWAKFTPAKSICDSTDELGLSDASWNSLQPQNSPTHTTAPFPERESQGRGRQGNLWQPMTEHQIWGWSNFL